MTKLSEVWGDFKNGLIAENPLLRLMIGLCSVLAVSTRVENGIFLGIGATFVLVSSNILISAIRKIIPDQIRIPIFIVIIASFVTIVDLTMRAYFPAIYARLGVWVPLIVVNCIVLGRAEAFASKYPLLRSAADGLGMGIGYIGLLVVMGVIRELFGTGQIILFDKTVINFGPSFQSPTILIMFPGAFLVFGFIMALLNWIQDRG
jgi:electron transport complex protein RnfE